MGQKIIITVGFVGFCVSVCIQKPSHHLLQTYCPLRMFKIVFRDISLYP